MLSHDKISLLRDPSHIPVSPESRGYESLNNPITPPTPNVLTSSTSTSANSNPKTYPQYIAALAATLSALAAGAVLGWTSPILNEIEKGKFNKIPVDSNQMGWIGSFVALGAMTMCFPAGFICDLIGRKKTLLLLILPFSIGWALILFAESVMMLYFGRLVTGMAVGACCVAGPLYASEIAQKEIRGTLGSYFQLMVTIGIFLAYTSGKFLNPIHYTILCAALPAVFVLIFAFQPESPVYCLKKNMYDQALTGLIKLRGDSCNVDAELAEIEGRVKESMQVSVAFTRIFKRKAVRKAFLIAFCLMFFQQFSGINAVILYTSDIFNSSGVNLDANTAAIIVGAFQAFATFLSSLVVDKLGRRALLLTSSIFMALSSVFLALYFTLKFRLSMDVHAIGFLPVSSLCLFVIVFSIGLGPIPWMISAEIFPSEIKSVASSAAGTFNWFLAFLITKFYLQVNDLVGQDATFYFFSVISLIGAVFIYFVIPETKGKTVEEIQLELE